MLQVESYVNATPQRPKRPSKRPNIGLHLRCIRPSLSDWRFTGDAWILEKESGTLAVRLGDYELARINGSTLDLPSLNRILDQLRHRRPRRRS